MRDCGLFFGHVLDHMERKLLSAKAASQTEIKNVAERKETGIDRTRRLLYVTCSRAENSLALVAYTEENPSAVKSCDVQA